MTASVPGAILQVVPPPAEPAPLRTDIAGFAGSARRGPVGRAVRVVGETEARRIFGGLDPSAATGYALHGYFANGGQVAWVVRVNGGATASAFWSVGPLPGFPAARYRLSASSPGCWGNDLSVLLRYRATGRSGTPEVDVRVTAPGESVQTLTAVPPDHLPARFVALDLVRLTPEPAAPAPVVGAPRAADWSLTLRGGTDVEPSVVDYRRAAEALADQPEIALVVTPDLGAHLNAGARREVISALLDDAAGSLDRLVLLDGPPEDTSADAAVAEVSGLRAELDPRLLRAGALYHPRLRVPDPLSSVASPTRTLPGSGHVAGVICRLDRERGAHHSPANAAVDEAVDLDPQLGVGDLVALSTAGINPVRCQPGAGLQVWGARTLDPGPAGRFLAHRRLVHRLVRAFRAVALPLVFDINGPELRLALVRALTTVLLEAFQAGALAGARPAEAFVVTCDDTNNPASQDPGLVICDAAVAPAAPMEFIRLRLMLAQAGRLEVVEA